MVTRKLAKNSDDELDTTESLSTEPLTEDETDKLISYFEENQESEIIKFIHRNG